MIERAISTPLKSRKIIWNLSGALALAIGIWAMHFIGMLALKFPIPVTYDVSLTMLSIAPVFFACTAVMWLMTSKSYNSYRLLVGGLLLGSGIGLMHHIGMAAMRLNAVMVHDVVFVYLSILIAILLAIVALKIQYKVIDQKHYKFINRRCIFSAVTMGLAASGMHYTAMAAVKFIPRTTNELINGINSTVLTLIVAIATLVLLALAILIPCLLRYKQLIITVSEDAARIRSMMDISQDALIQMDTKGNIVGWSSRAQMTFGWTNKEAIGQELANLIIPPRFHNVYKQHLSHFLATNECAILNNMIEVKALHKARHNFPVELTVSIIKTENGYEFNAFARDISQRKKAERKLILANQELALQNEEKDKRANELMLAASVFTYALEGIMITDANTTVVDVNSAFTKISGYSRLELVGQKTRLLRSGLHTPQFYAEMWQIINTTGHWIGEIFNRNKNGEEYTVSMSVSAVKNAAGDACHYVALMSDITQQNEHQSQLEQIAHYDPLTKLPNRALLTNRLNQAIKQCKRDDKALAVAYMDLDGFKNINDTYGHAVGDKLLIIVSQKMKGVLRKVDTLARVGGDEFIAIIANAANNEDYKQTLKRLLRAVSEPIKIDEHILKISVSIGITLYPQDDADTDLLLRHCDQAMYLAKQSGKNCYHLFDNTFDDAINIKRESIENIKKAFNNSELILYHQPKVNMSTGELVGTEALIRWQHPERGLVPPLDFLPIIESHPISLDIGELVIDSALSQISQWQNMGITCPISVNISAYHLQQDNFVERLSILLAKHPDVMPANLELEILETSAFSDINKIVSTMRACIELGVKFALDDFGTGYSSLTYLRRLPASLIKIDQSFIRDMLTHSDDLAIVQGVVGLTKAFQLEVIAEGVETIEHGVALLQLGCELAQGYGIARPMPASDIPDWVSHWKPDPSWQVARPQ
ncbi:MAG: diguanylate cyclase (GGDEF)-like protein/PAS domain S-box-containing protein [Glaciecola sp.]|jgi:diguanylate cyclase (GGDEF)-like protein/PAS domain S-box-containing protein